MPTTRINDRETERKMLDVAVSLVHQQGISAELDDLAFEQIVQEAGVPRDSAYRRWPKLHKFYGEVLLELASGTTLPVTESAIAEPAGAIVLDRIEHLGTAQGRRNVVVEMFRVAIGADYDSIIASPEWNTFAALVACHQGIADDGIRDAVAAELAATEDRYVLARARVYAQLSAILGYRLVPPLAGPDGFELMSRAAGAAIMGLVAKIGLGGPAYESPRYLRAFGSTDVAEWRPSTYIMASTIFSFIEPDPRTRWSRARVEDLVMAIAQFASRK